MLSNNLPSLNKGVRVAPRSKAQIYGLAEVFRKLEQQDINQPCDILQLLEFELPKLTSYKFEFQVKDKHYMGETEAAISPDTMIMHIRQDVYDALHENDPRARFTIAHEFGHLILHEGTTLNRGTGTHKIYEDSEWQANQFAAELLAPLTGCKELNVEQIMQKYNISYQCASLRYKEIKN